MCGSVWDKDSDSDRAPIHTIEPQRSRRWTPKEKGKRRGVTESAGAKGSRKSSGACANLPACLSPCNPP